MWHRITLQHTSRSLSALLPSPSYLYPHLCSRIFFPDMDPSKLVSFHLHACVIWLETLKGLTLSPPWWENPQCLSPQQVLYLHIWGLPSQPVSHTTIACTYNSLLSQYNIRPQWPHHVHCEKKLSENRSTVRTYPDHPHITISRQ